MLYECDDKNCNIGKDLCCNRAFQDLAERTKKGGPYRIGVDVVKTSDRGFGVRSNREFAPGQIIMEYTGEIITEEECERRMNEEYKENEVSPLHSCLASLSLPPPSLALDKRRVEEESRRGD